MRIEVVRVGIIGASVRWHLASHGVEVVMIDALENCCKSRERFEKWLTTRDFFERKTGFEPATLTLAIWWFPPT
jgi:hypothetical protein